LVIQKDQKSTASAAAAASLGGARTERELADLEHKAVLVTGASAGAQTTP
jgi:hypothetical protein